jgi:hypothetical protein
MGSKKPAEPHAPLRRLDSPLVCVVARLYSSFTGYRLSDLGARNGNHRNASCPAEFARSAARAVAIAFDLQRLSRMVNGHGRPQATAKAVALQK